jgi:O-acetyl-ADP-ribose deacetylase (regulator of RNase III)
MARGENHAARWKRVDRFAAHRDANILHGGLLIACRALPFCATPIFAHSMNITYRVGDATHPQEEGAKVIVHVCNDVGGWGRGFVVALSRRWPRPEQQYRAWYRGDVAQPFALGEVQFVVVDAEITVANLIGQHGLATRQRTPPVRYDAIRTGLRSVAQYAAQHSASVHMPRIGCGLAGGKWEDVEPIIAEELSVLGIAVFVYDLPAARL